MIDIDTISRCCSFTTLGYGDMVPVTILGRIFAGFSGIWGIVMIALPAAVIG